MERLRWLALFLIIGASGGLFAADGIHWTLTGQTSVTFDWRGPETTIEYGTLPGHYTGSVIAVAPSPLPDSSPGPYREAAITGLQEGRLYYYRIGSGPERTFRTSPPRGSSNFWFSEEADIGSCSGGQYDEACGVQAQVAEDNPNIAGDDRPRFVVVPGDLSYGDRHGTTAVDGHFNDVMVWSEWAAYMPIWGNHEWDEDSEPDELNNYEGRFAFPNSRSVPGAEEARGNGPDDDWYWFDYGNVRFITYPEPYSSETLDAWDAMAGLIMAEAQNDPAIKFIVTYGHRPAYSTGEHGGDDDILAILAYMRFFYPKYVLNIAAHDHYYERSIPSQTNDLLHIVGAGGGATMTSLGSAQSYTAFRLHHLHHLKIRVSTDRIDGYVVCGPEGADAEDSCTEGSIVDTWSITSDGYAPDSVPPGVPAGLAAVPGFQGEIQLTWDDATDNVGVDGYTVFRTAVSGGCTPVTNGDCTQIAHTLSSDFTDTGLPYGTTLYYSVQAHDVSGNDSGASGEVGGATHPPPNCGNGELENGEQCDGGFLRGATCEGLGFLCSAGPEISCKPDCTYDTSGCVPGFCGDGILQNLCGEVCDSSDVGGETCQDYGYATGDMACGADCSLDLSDCALCGNGIVESGEHCDGAVLGASCADLGCTGEVITCLAGCTVDFSGCTGCPPFLFVHGADPACSDGGVGSVSVPFCTIGAAEAAAEPGDTVIVAGGIYPENVQVDTSGTAAEPITFRAATGHEVEVTGPYRGFEISGESWVTIEGFRVRDTSSYGIYVKNSSDITITGNHVSGAGESLPGLTQPGIYVHSTTNSTISDNTASDNSDSGIYVTSESTGNTIVGNVVSNNARVHARAACGLSVRSPDNTIQGNVVFGNELSGIQIRPYAPGSPADNNLVVGNSVFSNGEHGIDVDGSSDLRIVGNTIYDNRVVGILLRNGSQDAVLANNISVENGKTGPSGRANISVDSSSISGTSIDHDLVFLNNPGVMFSWGTSQYSWLADFRAASGQEDNGLQADPLWLAPELGDFQLTAGSPAIDSANSGADGALAIDLMGLGRIDDPSTSNTGSGPRAFDDRGAYEMDPCGDLEIGCDGIDNDCDPATADDVDGDGDGAGCLLDCDDLNPNCAFSCTDSDGDGYCAASDCDDAVSTCNADCLDSDGDGVPACAGDCDANSSAQPGATEINDGQDNQCPGDSGYGLIDEVEGLSFRHASSKHRLSWDAQPGATLYEVIRTDDPDVTTGCFGFPPTSSTTFLDPMVGSPIRYYLVRALLPNVGSLGHGAQGLERVAPFCE